MNRQDKKPNIQEMDKSKKHSPKTDDKIKRRLNEHNLEVESANMAEKDISHPLQVSFTIEPKLSRIEDVNQLYNKFSAERDYMKASWFHLPEIDESGKHISLLFANDTDLNHFQQRLINAGFQGQIEQIETLKK